MKNDIALRALAVVLLLFAGCASSAGVTQMSVTAPTAGKAPVTTPLRDNIGVKDVTGGEETNPLWKSKIGSADFRSALENSLSSAGLLEKAKGEGRYSLSATLEKVVQPTFGFSVTVTTQVKYVLTELKSGAEVFQETISGEYTAKTSEALSGVTRLKIANEGAVRDNIGKLIAKLLNLNLAP